MSYKKYLADATIVNAQDAWNDKKISCCNMAG